MRMTRPAKVPYKDVNEAGDKSSGANKAQTVGEAT
jgi:hypothetical protein